MNHYRLACFAVVVAGVLQVTTVAFAQTTHGERTFRGVFGAATSGADVRHNLEFSTTLAEAYDDDVFADLRTTLDPAVPPESGYSTMLLPTLVYSWRGRRVQVAGSGASSLRYYPDLDQVRSMTHDASLGLSGDLGRNTSFSVNQWASYSPVYLFRLFPVVGDVALGSLPPGADYSFNRSESYSYRTALTLTRTAGRRGRFQASSEVDFTDFRHQDRPQPDMRTIRTGGEYSHAVTRNVEILSRYEYRTGGFGYVPNGTAREHRADIGFNYSKPISPTRRSTFEVRLGASTMQIGAGSDENIPPWRRQFQGELNTAYDLGRTWQARAGARRGAEFVPTLSAPVYADSVTIGVDGLVTRRIETHVSAAYSTGESALARNALTFDTYAGTVRLRFGVTSTVAPYVEYLYYFYDFRGSARELPDGIPQRLERNGIRAGLTLWIPLMRR